MKRSRGIFKKSDVIGNTKTVRMRIITAITLVFRAIFKKNAHGKMGREFVSLNSGQKNKTSATESAKMPIGGRKGVKTFIKCDSRENGGRGAIDKID